MPHPEGGASWPLHPVVVSRVGVRGGVHPEPTGPSGNQEERGQVAVATARWMDPGELHAVLVFPVVAVGGVRGGGWVVIIFIIPLIVTIIITVITTIIFILVIFITAAAIMIIKKRQCDGRRGTAVLVCAP